MEAAERKLKNKKPHSNAFDKTWHPKKSAQNIQEMCGTTFKPCI